MPEFPKHVEIFRGHGACALRIDGQDLPWYVSDEITTSVRRGEQAKVTISLLPDEVSVRDQKPEPEDSPTTDPEEIAEWFAAPPPRSHCGVDPTGPLARAEAARDQAEELLRNAQRALEENHATIAELRRQLAERAESDPENKHRVGVAYVEVRPDFSPFEEAVKRVAHGPTRRDEPPHDD